eukprot:TRINITY_DN7221_c0_g1_i1.p1 TRINITY_DN7221_c0_g1~~TRINITY_DN7221_c0_g1_i1.p1  ORF type:complete len:165 (-),score=0.09 TRINITY_DN7221_c0_g1_i1:116-610(-)
MKVNCCLIVAGVLGAFCIMFIALGINTTTYFVEAQAENAETYEKTTCRFYSETRRDRVSSCSECSELQIQGYSCPCYPFYYEVSFTYENGTYWRGERLISFGRHGVYGLEDTTRYCYIDDTLGGAYLYLPVSNYIAGIIVFFIFALLFCVGSGVFLCISLVGGN